jgi:hypothetical protein
MAHSKRNIKDADVMMEKAEIPYEEVAYLAQLTPEEKVIERKLRRRIDLLIMPLVTDALEISFTTFRSFYILKHASLFMK